MSAPSVLSQMTLPLITRRVRAYFAPVNHATATPTIFDPAVNANWMLSAPPAPWVDLGWITSFSRTSESTIAEVDAGVPAIIKVQSRQKLGALVSFRFLTWGKLAMALAASSQHMNVLAPAGSSSAVGSGAKAAAAVALGAGSGGSVLYPAVANPAWQVGSIVAVDEDYNAQIGFVGAGIAGDWIESTGTIRRDADAIRRVTFNIGRIVAIGADGGLRLATPLYAGMPTSSMKIQQVVGFVDREGGMFFQEWSALFVSEGTQGEKVFFHYPRLQACQGAAEATVTLGSSLEINLLDAKFRALPVTDGNDGAQVLCYRTFVPGTACQI